MYMHTHIYKQRQKTNLLLFMLREVNILQYTYSVDEKLSYEHSEIVKI